MFTPRRRHIHRALSRVLELYEMRTVDMRTARSVWSAPGLPALMISQRRSNSAGKPGALHTLREIGGRICVLLVVVFCVWRGPAQAAGAPVEHVLIIGCDGFGSISITPTNTPVLHKLMRAGAYTLHARG